jgi:hypothetical protein
VHTTVWSDVETSEAREVKGEGKRETGAKLCGVGGWIYFASILSPHSAAPLHHASARHLEKVARSADSHYVEQHCSLFSLVFDNGRVHSDHCIVLPISSQ